MCQTFGGGNQIEPVVTGKHLHLKAVRKCIRAEVGGKRNALAHRDAAADEALARRDAAHGSAQEAGHRLGPGGEVKGQIGRHGHIIGLQHHRWHRTAGGDHRRLSGKGGVRNGHAIGGNGEPCTRHSRGEVVIRMRVGGILRELITAAWRSIGQGDIVPLQHFRSGEHHIKTAAQITGLELQFAIGNGVVGVIDHAEALYGRLGSIGIGAECHRHFRQHLFSIGAFGIEHERKDDLGKIRECGTIGHHEITALAQTVAHRDFQRCTLAEGTRYRRQHTTVKGQFRTCLQRERIGLQHSRGNEGANFDDNAAQSRRL